MISPGAAPQYFTAASTPPSKSLHGLAVAASAVVLLGTPFCCGGFVAPRPFPHRLHADPGLGAPPAQVNSAAPLAANTDGAAGERVTGAGLPSTPSRHTSTFK